MFKINLEIIVINLIIIKFITIINKLLLLSLLLYFF